MFLDVQTIYCVLIVEYTMDHGKFRSLVVTGSVIDLQCVLRVEIKRFKIKKITKLLNF